MTGSPTIETAGSLPPVERAREESATGYGSGRARILVTAERLFGELGTENVSLRQIAVAAGQGNNSAVALHFGSKEGLIHAILETRRPAIDAIRKKRFEAVTAQTDAPSLRDLVECLMMPWADDVDDEGNHPYARFIAQLMWADKDFYPLGEISDSPEAAREVMHRIRAQVPDLSEREFSLRLRLMVGMFLTSALHKGKVGFSSAGTMEEAELFGKVIDLTVAALTSPV